MLTPTSITDFSVMLPALTEKSFRIHYEEHYLKYIDNANKRMLQTFNNLSLKDLCQILSLNVPVGQNVHQVFNHEFFFEQFSNDPKEPELLLEFVDKSDFRDRIVEQTNMLFGNGYLWVSLNSAKKLVYHVTENAGNFTKLKGWTPILNIDLWEHSYYLDYRSDRQSYVNMILDTIDYSVIDNRIKNAKLY